MSIALDCKCKLFGRSTACGLTQPVHCPDQGSCPDGVACAENGGHYSPYEAPCRGDYDAVHCVPCSPVAQFSHAADTVLVYRWVCGRDDPPDWVVLGIEPSNALREQDSVCVWVGEWGRGIP